MKPRGRLLERSLEELLWSTLNVKNHVRETIIQAV